MFKQIAQEAFNDELIKLAGIPTNLYRTARNVAVSGSNELLRRFHPNYIRGSFENLNKAKNDLINVYKSEDIENGLGQKGADRFINNLSKSKMALATIGATAATIKQILKPKYKIVLEDTYQDPPQQNYFQS